MTMQTWTFPDDWKKANVTHIFLKGSKGNSGNYRPVSLTLIVSILWCVSHSQIFRRFYTVMSVAAPIFWCFYIVLPIATSKIGFLSVIGSQDHQAFSMYANRGQSSARSPLSSTSTTLTRSASWSGCSRSSRTTPRLQTWFRSNKDVQDLQLCLNNRVDWADKWGMQFNVSKCKVM